MSTTPTQRGRGISRLSILFWGVAALVSFGACCSEEVTLTWDSSLDPEVMGYRIHYGEVSGPYSQVADVQNVSQATVVDLQRRKTYRFFVTCYSTSGLESDPSSGVDFTVSPNRAPVADSLEVVTGMDQSVQIVLTGRDPDQDPLTFRVVEPPQYGSIDGSPPLLTYLPSPKFVGTDTFLVTAYDGSLESAPAVISVTVTPPSTNYTRVDLEAEAGTLTSPMAIQTDPVNSLQYISSPTSSQGSASYSFTVPSAGDYVVWCHVRATNGSSDSVFVSMDGGTTDIFDVAECFYTDGWRWVLVNGRGTGSPFTTRVFHLTAGPHVLLISTREPDTPLDKLIITDDRTFAPPGATLPQYQPAVTILSMTHLDYGSVISWSSVPGNSYQVFAKNSFADLQWRALSDILVAEGTETTWADTDPGSSTRFYRVFAAPYTNYTRVDLEAEAGTLTNPMAIQNDPVNSLQYISSPTSGQGSASYSFTVPSAGDYVVWCHVRATNGSSDSVFVSMDGGTTDIFDVAECFYTNGWRWVLVNGRGTGSPFTTRVFHLTAGPHVLLISTREPNTPLDELIITDDRSFAPPGATLPQYQPAVTILSLNHLDYGSVISWSSVPGNSYQVFAKNSFADLQWRALSDILVAEGTETTWADTDPGSGTRFYRIFAAP